MNRLEKIIKEVLTEKKKKRDRCLRIADRKFDKPSAYKSGAVVRCRKGSIWKGVKEDQLREIIKKTLLEDESLHKWFKRSGPKGKGSGWVDCNTCKDGSCKACGRKKGEKRSKYPSCRPTPAKCKDKGKGKKWGKTKLLNILKEIQIQPKKMIGQGEQGNVYNVGNNKIVKRSTYQDGFTPDEIEIYNLFNQHPNIFPHIYKLTKNYVIMDKLNSPGKSLGDVYNFLDNIDPLSGDSMPWREEDFLNNIYKDLYNNNLEIFNLILQKAKKLNRMDIYNTLKKCLDFCIELKKIFKNKRIDVTLGNVGIDNGGKIKIFDASFGDDDFYDL